MNFKQRVEEAAKGHSADYRTQMAVAFGAYWGARQVIDMIKDMGNWTNEKYAKTFPSGGDFHQWAKYFEAKIKDGGSLG